MSAFRRFNISHLSPSSLNCWISTPGLWCLRYLAQVRDETNAAMARGTAVEKGFECIKQRRVDEDPTSVAQREFQKLTLGEINDEIEAEAALIPGMMKQCAKFHADLPMELAATQLKIETRLDGVPIPVIGYVDFTHIDGPDIDLKTTKACPSKPRADHVRQIALYWNERRKPAGLLYVTDKKLAYYCPPEADLQAAVNDLSSAARSLERFLTHMPSADAALRSLPNDVEHFAYGNAAKAKLIELQEAF